MLHRYDSFFLNVPLLWQCFGGFIIFLILAVPSAAGSQENAAPNTVPGIFDIYQDYISPVDGDRCPMVPSCSGYIKTAVKKHGAVMGLVMGFDRIVRCGRDEAALSSSIWVNGKKQIYDPVENNDFWWSEK